MHPFSYTTLKIIHDRKIQEAQEQQRVSKEHKSWRPGPIRMVETFLARVFIRPDHTFPTYPASSRHNRHIGCEAACGEG